MSLNLKTLSCSPSPHFINSCKHAHNSSLLPHLAEIDQAELTTLPTTAPIPAECVAVGWQDWWCQNGGTAIYWPDRQYCGCTCAPGFTNFYCDGEYSLNSLSSNYNVTGIIILTKVIFWLCVLIFQQLCNLHHHQLLHRQLDHQQPNHQHWCHNSAVPGVHKLVSMEVPWSLLTDSVGVSVLLGGQASIVIVSHHSAKQNARKIP